MKSIEKRCAACKIAMGACFAVALGLVIAGFIVPPMGVIDGSTLTAVGEIFAFAALAAGMQALTLGYDLRLQKGNTTIDLNNNSEGSNESVSA